MARKAMNTTIEMDLQTALDEFCREKGMKKNEVIEALIKACCVDKIFSIHTTYTITLKDKTE